jgi:hypothetical protein
MRRGKCPPGPLRFGGRPRVLRARVEGAQGVQQRRIRVREGVALNEPHRKLLGRHWTEPVDRCHRSDEGFRADTAVETDLAGRDGIREATNRVPGSRWEADRVEVRGGQGLGGGKVRLRPCANPGISGAHARTSPSGRALVPARSQLWRMATYTPASNGPHAPGTRCPGRARTSGAMTRSPARCAAGVRVQVEAEHAPDPLDDVDHPFPVRQVRR